MTKRIPTRADPCRRRLTALALATYLVTAGVAPAAPAHAQDGNVVLPVREIESRLQEQPFRILDWRGSRKPEDRTQRAALAYEDSLILLAKWANAPTNASVYNNEPRYEVAAYLIQRLFLDEPDYVVPPTVVRSVPLSMMAEQMRDARPTFREAPASVLVTLQYWLWGVTDRDFWDDRRARTDSVYARHIGNFNALTVVIRHSDANRGNYLISEDSTNPRVFAVDNGVSFASADSDRGYEWRELRVQRLPRRTVERLETVTRQQLDDLLGVIAEFEVRDGELIAVPPGPNLSPNRGVRRTAERIQLGLTSREIRAIELRIRDLLRQANGHRIELF
ncbi:MAG: hypothetical protein KFH98_05030 [Gemmatimonadetes bacterium]|nr:hypothetical protein [Gemmatimonadota bacterium]